VCSLAQIPIGSIISLLVRKMSFKMKWHLAGRYHEATNQILRALFFPPYAFK